MWEELETLKIQGRVSETIDNKEEGGSRRKGPKSSGFWAEGRA